MHRRPQRRLSYGSSISEIDFLNANLAGSVNLNNPSGASTLTVTGSTLSASMQSALQVNNANGAVSLTLDAASQVVATPTAARITAQCRSPPRSAIAEISS